jgi:hypothetical protein
MNWLFGKKSLLGEEQAKKHFLFMQEVRAKIPDFFDWKITADNFLWKSRIMIKIDLNSDIAGLQISSSG